MNKDVIYVEPEDDITDIITKIENSSEKIVVLVPPKKAGVFRSMVNMKLIARAGSTAEKTVVLVTVDPSIIKLAASARIPVTKDLKTAPVIPAVEAVETAESENEIIETADEDDEEEERVRKSRVADDDDDNDEEEDEEENDEDDVDEEEEDEEEEKPKKAKKAAKKAPEHGAKGWFKAHKVPVTICAVAAIAAIVFCAWAFGVAPAVTVAVEIQTETKSFAENVNFTTNPQEEDAKNGIFYVQEKKLEQAQEIKMEATGKKNIGEKASGEVTVYSYFKSKSNVIPVSEGATFAIQGQNFTVTKGANLSWDGRSSSCENAADDDDISGVLDYGCLISRKITVEAASGGSASNLSWTGEQIISAGLYSDGLTSGGSDKEVTIVEQIDVEKAKDQLKASNEAEDKQKLLESVEENMLPIELSFTETTSASEPSPAVGEEVQEGKTPMLKVVTTAKMYAIDKSKVEEFISEKVQLADNQKIYEFQDSFVENFSQNGKAYTGRLKTNYDVGPKVTDNDVVEMIKGKGLGDIQHDLKNITGIVNVTIEKSYPWVMQAPKDTNKITVEIEIQGAEKSEA